MVPIGLGPGFDTRDEGVDPVQTSVVEVRPLADPQNSLSDDGCDPGSRLLDRISCLMGASSPGLLKDQLQTELG